MMLKRGYVPNKILIVYLFIFAVVFADGVAIPDDGMQFSTVNSWSTPFAPATFTSESISSFVELDTTIDTTLVVGDEPGEVVELTGVDSILGHILVINDGHLIIHACTLYVNGTLAVFNTGQVQCDTSYVTLEGDIYIVDEGVADFRKTVLIQLGRYSYDTTIRTYGKGQLLLEDVWRSSGGVGGDMMVKDSSTLVQHRVWADDWTCCSVRGHAIAVCDSINQPGEWMLYDSGSVFIHHAPVALIWPYFGFGDTLDISLPGSVDSIYILFTSGPECAQYIYLEDIGNVTWAPQFAKGCHVTVRDCYLGPVGIINYEDSMSLSNLYNYQYYADHTFDWFERTVRWINVQHWIWNLLLYGGFTNLSNMVVSEIHINDQAVGDSVTVDEAAGTFNIHGGGYGQFTNSHIKCGTRVNGQGLLRNCRHDSYILADFNGRLVLIDCEILDGVYALQKSRVAAVNLNIPDTATVGDTIIVSGTALHLWGQDTTGPAVGWELSISPDEDTVFHDLASGEATIINDVLCSFSIDTLIPGDYLLRLWLTSDSLPLDTLVASYRRLHLIEQAVDENLPQQYIKLIDYTIQPSVFNSSTNICYSIVKAEHIELKIYNVAGRLIRTLVKKKQKPGGYVVNWFGEDQNRAHMGSGIYFCHLKIGHTFQQIKKIILLR